MRPLGTKKDAAAFLGVSEKTIQRRVRQKRMPYIRLGRRALRFDMDALEKYVQDNTTNPRR